MHICVIYATEQSPSSALGFSASQEIPRMINESYLPHLQMPSICLYPEPDESSPCPNIQSREDFANTYSNRYSEQDSRQHVFLQWLQAVDIANNTLCDVITY